MWLVLLLTGVDVCCTYSSRPQAWLSTCSGSWSGTFATAATSVTYLTDVSNTLSHTPYAIGYTLTSVVGTGVHMYGMQPEGSNMKVELRAGEPSPSHRSM
jgi:hypothetical protein